MFQDELDEWFDIYSLTDPSTREELQIEGLHDSIEFIHGIISEEAKIVTPENVILLGLSQGSATGKLSQGLPYIGYQKFVLIVGLAIRLTRFARWRPEVRRIRRPQWVASSKGASGEVPRSG